MFIKIVHSRAVRCTAAR